MGASRGDLQFVLITPLLGAGLGRQGSSGSGSWANTESSPEEQVLLESWQVGEYCSKGTARSRYSCQGRGQRSDSTCGNASHTDTAEARSRSVGLCGVRRRDLRRWRSWIRPGRDLPPAA